MIPTPPYASMSLCNKFFLFDLILLSLSLHPAPKAVMSLPVCCSWAGPVGPGKAAFPSLALASLGRLSL